VADDPNLFRRYLLGELLEEEQEALERNLIANDENFQELLIAEEELVDDFCEGNLSASEERKYREHFLVTRERRDQHRFGAVLRKYLSKPNAQGSKWRPFLAAAAVGLLAIGLGYILRPDAPYQLLPTPGSLETSTAAFFLTTGNLRSTEPVTEQTLTVPAGSTHVALQLDVPAGTRGDYDVRIENQRSGAILAEGKLPAETIEDQSVVVASIPSELLRSGEYRVILQASSTGGQETVSRTYEFRVTSP
jgi:hypothetical protein